MPEATQLLCGKARIRNQVYPAGHLLTGTVLSYNTALQAEIRLQACMSW